MTCSDVQQSLEAQSDPAAPQIDAAVSAHLKSCPACAAYAARVKRDDALLSEILSAGGHDVNFVDHRRAVTGKINAFEVRRGWSRRAWVATAAAAMLALTAWGVVNFVHPKPSEVALVTPGAVQSSDASLSARVATLQASVRDKQVLDELEQLQDRRADRGGGTGDNHGQTASGPVMSACFTVPFRLLVMAARWRPLWKIICRN